MLFMYWQWFRCQLFGHQPENVYTGDHPFMRDQWFNTVCRRCGRSPLWGRWWYVGLRQD